MNQNKFEALPILAINFDREILNKINWNLNEIRRIERMLLSMCYMYHPKTETDRLYLPRENAGVALDQQELI